MPTPKPSAPSNAPQSKARENAYVTLRKTKWISIAALVLAVGNFAIMFTLVATNGPSPDAIPGELYAASECAKARLAGEIVRLELQAGLEGQRALRRSDVALAEQLCAVVPPQGAPTGAALLLFQQSNALGIPGTAPATK